MTAPVLPDAVLTVGRLCDEFSSYVAAHPDEYRDQKNPPRRIAEIKTQFGDRETERLKPSEIESWLDAIQSARDLSPATVNKLWVR